MLTQFIQSFKDKKILPIFLVDIVFFGVISALFYYFGEKIKEKSAAFTGFTSAEQLQQAILSSPEQAEILLTTMKSFILTFLIGLIILLALLVLGFALSRAWIWNYLLGKKLHRKNYWRWNLLVLTLIIPLVLYLFASLVVRGILSYLFSFLNNVTVLQLLNNLIVFVLILFFFVFVFIVYYLFTSQYRVWQSIGDTFNFIKIKWGKLWKFFLFVLATGLVVNVILVFIPKLITYFFIHPTTFSLLNTGIFLLFLAWMRVYLVKTIGHQ